MDEIYLISTSANYIHDDGGQYVKKKNKENCKPSFEDFAQWI